mmetsp:Transcript_18939/g.27889  ORF Transcript_18939/g.27889 Transcript_18939/m.27889 type:complete len:446 (-) Transcript_18939:119-1456(-)
MADLRPPIPPEHIYRYNYILDTPISRKNGVQIMDNGVDSNINSQQILIESTPFLLKLLSNIYVANLQLQLGTETSFTSFVIFHRFLGHYLHHSIIENTETNHNVSTGEEGIQCDGNANVSSTTTTTETSPHNLSVAALTLNPSQRKQLSNIAAASIFLACKLCNEQRRIRDVINMKHVLQFERDCNYNYDDHNGSLVDGSSNHAIKSHANAEKSTTSLSSSSEGALSLKHSSTKEEVQPPPPPKLDEEYWNMKEEMVRTEQTLLRIIQFDVNISYPHRIMIVLWEELLRVTNIGRPDVRTTSLITDNSIRRSNSASNENGGKEANVEMTNGIRDASETLYTPLPSEVWAKVLKSAWTKINNSVFSVDSLSLSAADLGCAAISLAMDDNDVDVTAIGVTDQLDSSCLVSWWEWMGVHLSDMNNAKLKLVEASEVVKKFSEGKFNTL